SPFPTLSARGDRERYQGGAYSSSAPATEGNAHRHIGPRSRRSRNKGTCRLYLDSLVQGLISLAVGLVAAILRPDGVEATLGPSFPGPVLVEIEVHEPGADQCSNEESAHVPSRLLLRPCSSGHTLRP